MKMNVHISSQTKEVIIHQAQFFHDRVAKGENIDSVAANMKIRVFESQPLTPATPLLGSTDLTSWIFSSKLGSISDPKKIRGNAVVVLQVSDVKERGVRPFDDVKAAIKQKLIARKKLDDLVAKAQSIYVRAYTDSLEHVMAFDSTLKVRYVTNVQPMNPVQGLGTDFAFNVALFSLQHINEMSQPVRGSHGVYLIQLRGKALPNDSMYVLQKEVIRTSLLTQRKNTFVQAWMQKQKESAKIEDKRDIFFQNF